MTNWKTTASGAVAVGSMCGALATQLQPVAVALPWLTIVQPYLVLAGLIAGVVNAFLQKDHDVQGGTRYQ